VKKKEVINKEHYFSIAQDVWETQKKQKEAYYFILKDKKHVIHPLF